MMEYHIPNSMRLSEDELIESVCVAYSTDDENKPEYTQYLFLSGNLMTENTGSQGIQTVKENT